MDKEIEDYLNLGYQSRKDKLIDDMELYCKYNNITMKELIKQINETGNGL